MDPYKILGIDKDASADEIRRAYRKKASQYHPDKGGDVWIFQQIQDAYDELTGKKKKKKRKRPKPASEEQSQPTGSAGPFAEDPFGFDIPDPPERGYSHWQAHAPKHPRGRRQKRKDENRLLWTVASIAGAITVLIVSGLLWWYFGTGVGDIEVAKATAPETQQNTVENKPPASLSPDSNNIKSGLSGDTAMADLGSKDSDNSSEVLGIPEKDLVANSNDENLPINQENPPVESVGSSTDQPQDNSSFDSVESSVASPPITLTKPHKDKLWCQFSGKTGPGAGKHVVLIAGDDEYRSEEVMPMLGKILAEHHGFKCTVLFPINDEAIIQPDLQTNIPGLHLLEDADLMIVGLRFRNLSDQAMKYFADYVESSQPIIGIRTSTHAFRIPEYRKYARYSWNYRGSGGWNGGFGKRILGETWVAHHGLHGEQSTRGVVERRNADHPILTGVDDVWGPTDVYKINNLPTSATVLLNGQVLSGMRPSDRPVTGKINRPMMPLAWTLRPSNKTGRVFCTTMGAATDFQSAGLRRLIVNAAYWCVNLEDKIQSDLNVTFVDDYSPAEYGVGKHVQNRRPSDYLIQ